MMEELSTVLALLRKQAGADAAKGPGLVVSRVISGVSLPEWESFARKNGLESWLAIPLAGSLATAISAVMSVQENLARQRDIDALTGIGNRGFFDRRLNSEVERAKRLDTQLALVMLDIDDFKKVNDTYGHACGDAVLRRLADMLGHSIRPYDTAARYGGEEFALLLPGASSWTAANLARRILDNFSKEVFTCRGEDFVVTFSAGVSTLSFLGKGANDGEGLARSADEALYQAKTQGKNQVVVYQDAIVTDGAGRSLVRSQEKQFLFSGFDDG